MHIYIYLCMLINIHLHTYVYIHVLIFKCICVCLCEYECVGVVLCAETVTGGHKDASAMVLNAKGLLVIFEHSYNPLWAGNVCITHPAHARARAHTLIHTHTCEQTQIHTHMHTCIQTHRHTHMFVGAGVYLYVCM